MDPAEEQQQELEVLESIYPDEITKHSDTHFDISLKLDTASTKSHALILTVRYPPEYPEVVPELSLEAEEGSFDDDDDSDDDYEAKQFKKNINLPELVSFDKSDVKSILDKLNEEAELQIGMPSVFALASVCKDEGEFLFTEKLQQLENNREAELLKQEEELSKKFIGTKVTKESYTEWRNKFRKEMKIDDRLAQFYKAQHNGKLSGREIFEQGLANDEDIIEGLEQIKV